jgi:hypothetical protein
LLGHIYPSQSYGDNAVSDVDIVAAMITPPLLHRVERAAVEFDHGQVVVVTHVLILDMPTSADTPLPDAARQAVRVFHAGGIPVFEQRVDSLEGWIQHGTQVGAPTRAGTALEGGGQILWCSPAPAQCAKREADCLSPAAAGSYCLPGMSPMRTSLGWASGPPQVVYGPAAADVSHLTVTLSNGETIRVHTVAVGEQKYFAFVLRKGVRLVRWTAYDSAGRVVNQGGALGP